LRCSNTILRPESSESSDPFLIWPESQPELRLDVRLDGRLELRLDGRLELRLDGRLGLRLDVRLELRADRAHAFGPVEWRFIYPKQGRRS
jgi:hypothetical protein